MEPVSVNPLTGTTAGIAAVAGVTGASVTGIVSRKDDENISG